MTIVQLPAGRTVAQHRQELIDDGKEAVEERKKINAEMEEIRIAKDDNRQAAEQKQSIYAELQRRRNSLPDMLQVAARTYEVTYVSDEYVKIENDRTGYCIPATSISYIRIRKLAE